jgi:translation initiation factor 1 (eIF-1/SUI1)
MADSFGSGPVKEFNLALDELEANLAFLRTSTKLRPRLNGLLNWQAIQGEAKSLVADFLNQKSLELSAQYRGMLVVLSGAFEHLVRRIIHEAVLTINTSVKNYDELSEKVRVQNIFRTGRALTTIREPPEHMTVDYNNLAKRLATCLAGADSFTLNAEAFTLFISTVSPRHLLDVCDSVGITVVWDDFGREKKFESMFATKGVRATGKAVADQLEKFTKLRNRFAHAGAGGVVLTDGDLESFIQFFRIFGTTLCQLVAAKLKSS